MSRFHPQQASGLHGMELDDMPACRELVLLSSSFWHQHSRLLISTGMGMTCSIMNWYEKLGPLGECMHWIWLWDFVSVIFKIHHFVTHGCVPESSSRSIHQPPVHANSSTWAWSHQFQVQGSIDLVQCHPHHSSIHLRRWLDVTTLSLGIKKSMWTSLPSTSTRGTRDLLLAHILIIALSSALGVFSYAVWCTRAHFPWPVPSSTTNTCADNANSPSAERHNFKRCE